ncbi:hypothetical protein JCM5296_006197 [Sporobolomyces johnsonii]
MSWASEGTSADSSDDARRKQYAAQFYNQAIASAYGYIWSYGNRFLARILSLVAGKTSRIAMMPTNAKGTSRL